MADQLSRAEYGGEVKEQGEVLAEWSAQDVATYETSDGLDGIGDYETAVLENASEVLDAHEWFARSNYGPAFHGAVIQYAMEDGVDVARFNDWVGMVAGADDMGEMVKQMAYFAFESAVIEYAREQDPDDY